MINLAIIRKSASQPAQRAGVLFFNPGGPGGAGTDALPGWFPLFPSELRERFDLISWDPRGIGLSTAVQCFASMADEDRFFTGVPYTLFPVGGSEEIAWIWRFALFGLECARREKDLLAHVSTADTARDLELLRQAVGGEPLNYLGTSYGTLLGATYANLFPDHVRAMVLDGNVDPIAWTNGGKERALLDTSLRLSSDLAAAATLNALLDLCGQASTQHCAFSAGNPLDTHKKWKSLLRRLRAKPVTLNGNLVTYALLLTDMNAWLTTTHPEPTKENPEFKGWAYAGERLQQLWEMSAPGSPAAETKPGPDEPDATGEALNRKRAETYAGPEQRYAVQCAESPNPRNPFAFLELETLSYARARDIGPVWSWGDEPCATWPVRAADRYNGPWDRYTPYPILVVNNTLDPETPYAGALVMAGQLARGELLTVNGYGHTALLNPSTCVSNFEVQYFLDGTLPPPGTVCEQDAKPFTPPVP